MLQKTLVPLVRRLRCPSGPGLEAIVKKSPLRLLPRCRQEDGWSSWTRTSPPEGTRAPAPAKLAEKFIAGGSGGWGQVPC